MKKAEKIVKFKALVREVITRLGVHPWESENEKKPVDPELAVPEDTILRILTEADPMALICAGAPADEYKTEATMVWGWLVGSRTVNGQGIVFRGEKFAERLLTEAIHMIFVERWDARIVGDQESYRPIAQKILALDADGAPPWRQKMLSRIRNFISRAAIGGILGSILVMFYGPHIVSWWWRPPGPSTAFACDGQIASATLGLIDMQICCAGLGAVAYLLATFLWSRFRTRRNTSGMPVQAPRASR